MIERFSTYIKLIIALGAFAGIVLGFNAYFATAGEVQRVEQKLDYKIARDDMRDFQEQMWRIEDRYGYELGQMPQEMREQYRCLKRDYEEAKELVDGLRRTE